MCLNRLAPSISFAIPHESEPGALACHTELTLQADGTRVCRVRLFSGVGLSSFDALEHNFSEMAASHPTQAIIDLRAMPKPPTYLVHVLDTFIRAVKRNGGQVTMLLPALGESPSGRALFTQTGSRPPFKMTGC
ncbi:MAG: hypothetical protein ACFB20_05105 [Opitutales bacterium]